MNQPLATPGYSSFRIFRIIWVALAASQVFYVIVLFQVLFRERDPAIPARWMPNLADKFELGLAAAAALAAVASVLVPPFIVAAAKPPAAAEFAQPDEWIESRFFPGFIIRLALAEAVTLSGFALSSVKHTPELIFPFVAVGLAIYAKNFPVNPRKVRVDLAGV